MRPMVMRAWSTRSRARTQPTAPPPTPSLLGERLEGGERAALNKLTVSIILPPIGVAR